VLDVQLLRADHASALLSFEVENRSYFSAWISDRGDEYFEHFADRFDALLAEQRAGLGAYHVTVDDDASITGRFNLILGETGSAELGYRVAQKAAGSGLATAAVGRLCQLSIESYDVVRIGASVSRQNVASQRVLASNDFTQTGPADPAKLGGKQGYRYERVLI
jgi:ribosomal-protein-alanine N-acetyltransferase